jgi:hypothetical protein
MKGVNVKKIAALAAGALLAGSAIAVADVMYRSTQLVDQNGQPTVKIVVGSKAAITDGVAAANIAAVIANRAYKSSTLTAGVNGEPTCDVATGTGTGTCRITNEKVTLEVTVPGVVAGAYEFKTYISDYIDRTLQNRNSTADEDQYNASTLSSDVSVVVSPLKAYLGDVASARNMYKIGSSQYLGFADVPVVDQNAGADFAYTEQQSFWIGGPRNSPGDVYYEASVTYGDVVARYNYMAYSIRFIGNDYGIPMCTGGNRSNGDWADCADDDQYLTANHRVKIKYLGEDWIISSMTRSTTTDASSTTAVNGGEIKLAKEAKYAIVNVGGVLDAGNFKIRLSDISVAVGSENRHPAIIDVLDANDVVVGQIQVNPGSTYTFTQTGTANTVKVHVYKTAPGFTLNAKWAEIAIFTDEITLKDNTRIDSSSSGPNKYFYASLMWKNRDYTGASGSNDTDADSLREIVILASNDEFSSKYNMAGDSYNFPKSGTAYTVTYNGLGMADTDYDTLQMRAVGSQQYRVSAGGSACTAASSTDVQYTTKMIEITSSDNNFGGSGGLLGNNVARKFYYDPVGNNTNLTAGGSVDQRNVANESNYSPIVFYKPDGYDCYLWAFLVTNQADGSSNFVRYRLAGEDNTIGKVYFPTLNVSGNDSVDAVLNSTPYTSAPTGFNRDIVIREDAGKYTTASHVAVLLRQPIITNNTADSNFKFKTSDTQYTYYQALGGTTASAYEPKFVTERGSEFTGLSMTDATFRIAKKIAEPTFTFAASSANMTSGGAAEYILGEGEEQVLTGGVKVRVKSIDETVGSCVAGSAGGAPACTIDKTTQTPVIMPQNLPSVDAIVSYPLLGEAAKLVITDKQAPSVGVVIAVGGPEVNTLAADMVQGTAVDFKTEKVVVREMVPGSKILVAGATADDTLRAASDFIEALSK